MGSLAREISLDSGARVICEVPAVFGVAFMTAARKVNWEILTEKRVPLLFCVDSLPCEFLAIGFVIAALAPELWHKLAVCRCTSLAAQPADELRTQCCQQTYSPQRPCKHFSDFCYVNSFKYFIQNAIYPFSYTQTNDIQSVSLFQKVN